MKVLLIAPEAPGLDKLGWLREVFAIGEIPGVVLDVLGGGQATVGAIAGRLSVPSDIAIWSGHGRENQLICSDGVRIDGDWLACQVKPGAPRAVVLAACLSKGKDASLESLTGSLSRAGISSVGMVIEVEDMAASAYVIEFVRAMAAGADVGTADRVAGRMMASRFPGMAGVNDLVPGLTNGYSLIDRRLARLEERVAAIGGKVDALCEVMMGKR